jgi:hypothetical protein
MRFIIEDSRFNVIEDGTHLGFPSLYKELNIRFSSLNGLSYSLGKEETDPIEAIENTKKNWMNLIPYQEQVFTLDSVRKHLELNPDNKKYTEFLDEDKYELYFFINPFEPKTWYGFFALSLDDVVAGSHINLDCMYVRNEYREDNRGNIMAYEIGLIICDFFKKVIDENTDKKLDAKLVIKLGLSENHRATINEALDKGLFNQQDTL